MTFVWCCGVDELSWKFEGVAGGAGGPSCFFFRCFLKGTKMSCINFDILIFKKILIFMGQRWYNCISRNPLPPPHTHIHTLPTPLCSFVFLLASGRKKFKIADCVYIVVFLLPFELNWIHMFRFWKDLLCLLITLRSLKAYFARKARLSGNENKILFLCLKMSVSIFEICKIFLFLKYWCRKIFEIFRKYNHKTIKIV